MSEQFKVALHPVVAKVRHCPDRTNRADTGDARRLSQAPPKRPAGAVSQRLAAVRSDRRDGGFIVDFAQAVDGAQAPSPPRRGARRGTEGLYLVFMNNPLATLSSDFVRAFLDEAQVPDDDAVALLVQAGMGQAVLHGQSLQAGSARVTDEQFTALYLQLAARFDDELPNLLSHPMRCGAVKLAGLAIIGAGTLGGALARLTQFFRVVVHDFQTQLIDAPGVSMVYLAEPASGRRCKLLALVLVLKTIYRWACWLAGRDLPLQRVDFAFERPAYADSIIDMFPGRVSFGQEHTRLVLSAELCALRIQRTPTDLRVFLACQPRGWTWAPGDQQQVTRQVCDLLLEGNMAIVSIDQAAKALNLSTRTLCRKLEAEHTSFRATRDNLRRDRAIERLTASAAPIAEIAFELGFSNPSSFHRAFRGWTGATPAAFRERRATNDGGVNNGRLVPVPL